MRHKTKIRGIRTHHSNGHADATQLWIRARCTPRLKQRLADYLEREEARGNSKKESEVLRNLLVEFLDRDEAAHASAKPFAKRR